MCLTLCKIVYIIRGIGSVKSSQNICYKANIFNWPECQLVVSPRMILVFVLLLASHTHHQNTFISWCLFIFDFLRLLRMLRRIGKQLKSQRLHLPKFFIIYSTLSNYHIIALWSLSLMQYIKYNYLFKTWMLEEYLYDMFCCTVVVIILWNCLILIILYISIM